MADTRRDWDTQVVVLLLFASFAAIALPNWLLFPAASALTKGIAALGVIALMRTGHVTFGQALPLCIGGYVGALAPQIIGINDFFLNCLLGGLGAAGVNALLGAFMKRFSGIFFAMLTLAFSMVLYGMLANITALGGTDGFNTPLPSFLGYFPDPDMRPTVLFFCVGLMAAATLHLTNRFFACRLGWAARAIGANDIRALYLGTDVGAIVWLTIIYSGFLGGVAGAMVAASTGHVTPDLAYWTHSGDLVLIAILGNSAYGAAIFVASIVLEAVRVAAITLFPYTWQACLGIMLLIIVLVFPDGFDTVFRRWKSALGTLRFRKPT